MCAGKKALNAIDNDHHSGDRGKRLSLDHSENTCPLKVLLIFKDFVRTSAKFP
jgi:hypothetical protein